MYKKSAVIFHNYHQLPFDLNKVIIFLLIWIDYES